MAKIMPFKGYRYNAGKIPDQGKVISPPYDSISDDEQKILYEQSEYNIVRLAYGMTYPNDNNSNNKYTRSASVLKKWIENGIIVQDEKPAIYLCEQIVPLNEVQTHSSMGIVALLELEDFSSSSVMPCEETSIFAKNDRFNLLSATNANFGVINCIYSDQKKTLASVISEISETPPDVDFTAENGVTHRLWAITYNPTIQLIQEALADKPIVIADGQNRYEACLDYAKLMRRSLPDADGSEGYNYIMALFSNITNDEVLQRPVYRMVTNPKFKPDYLIAGAQDHFKVEKIIVDTNMNELVDTMRRQIATQRKENKIAFYCGGNYFYRFTLDDYDYMKTILPDKSDAYRSLDVTVLNHLIFSELMNITEDNYYERITYTKDAYKAVNAVNDGEYNCVFLINPTRPYQITEIAKCGEKMPERSICVFPKPATGLIMYKF